MLYEADRFQGCCEHGQFVISLFVTSPGNGKFESIIMAGQTGAANEETLALGGPVEIVAKREFFVNVSLIYVFSAETLKEETIEMKSQGQKEVENLGMNRFGSDLVSRMIAQYTQMEDERTGSRNQVPEILTEQKVEHLVCL